MSRKAMLVLTTVAKKSDATRLADALLRSKLAACVTTIPGAESRYVWKKKLCVEREWILLIKTMEKHFKALEKRLMHIHPYECPEIVGIPAARISAPYLSWLRASCE